jgi:hypothetical protein
MGAGESRRAGKAPHLDRAAGLAVRWRSARNQLWIRLMSNRMKSGPCNGPPFVERNPVAGVLLLSGVGASAATVLHRMLADGTIVVADKATAAA